MDISTLSLFCSTLVIIWLITFVRKFKSRKNYQLSRVFSLNLILVLIWTVALLCQKLFAKKFNIEPIYFDYVAYIGICFLPISIFLTGKVFCNTKITISKKYALLLIVPIISLAILWTNNIHHLFYKHYSTNLSEYVSGSYLIIHNIYSYSILLVGIIYILKAARRSSGFFSKQSSLILLGVSVPIVTNILGTFKIIPMTIYATPISFTIALLCFAIAIFKFKFLGVAPIALQTIVNKISDSYLVLNDDMTIVDFNTTFLNTFKLKDENIREQDIAEFAKNHKKYKFNVKKIEKAVDKVLTTKETVTFEEHIEFLDKYFTVEINALYNNDVFLGILLLFKDITQHKKDMQAIKDNQDMLMEKERLASLGQLIGGISHNLKTPIMSISGAAEGLTDLIKEYEASVGDPEVTVDDHHAIANDMKEWISKIHSYTAYMSDIITAVKGQAVALSENQNDVFTIDELLKRVDILMRHEIRNASLTLETKLDIPSSIKLKGDVNSLVQVVNNLITNAIQSYNGTKNEIIELIVKKVDNDLIISVADHGMGMTDEVKNKLFKSMITTKGKNGTGLGLFMSYSTIKGHFNGEMTFESEIGKGTTFNIILPLP